MGAGTRAGTKTGEVVEMGTGSRMRSGTGTRTGSERAEEKQRRARNRTRVEELIRHFHSACVITSADRGWRLRAPDSSVCKS